MTLSRIGDLLRIRDNELSLVALTTSMMFFANAGGAIGSPGVEALFYSRYGVEFLPNMYILLGLVTILTSLLTTALLGRTKQERVYILLPLAMTILLVIARAVLAYDVPSIYPVLWLGMNVFWVFQALALWGLAALVCDTRQAKRLFPLFGAGGIVGLTIGSLLTRPLVNVAGTDNLILFWGLGLLITFLLSIRLVSRHKLVAIESRRESHSTGILTEIEAGFHYVRSSALMYWMALAAIFLAILFYAIVFPFATTVSIAIPDESSLAAFLGTFNGLSMGAAVLASLLIANRLYARFGFMNMILVYPLLYLAGFSVVAIVPSFATIVTFRFAQSFWATGVMDGANQAIYNVVPPEHRGSARTFVQGIANQVGISLAGVILLLSASILETQHVFLIGIVAALFTVYFVWRARESYGPAVVEALRTGQSHIFFSDDEPFGGFRADATALKTALSAIQSPEVGERRIAAHILGRLSFPEATDALVAALDDQDPTVRAALLRAIGRSGATDAMLEVARYLGDPEPLVRAEAVSVLDRLSPYPGGIINYLEPMLDDPETLVQSRAAVALLKRQSHARAEQLLKQTALGEDHASDNINRRLLAFQALREWGSQEAYDVAAVGLTDPQAAIRRESATIMGEIDAESCVRPLRDALADIDSSVRESVAEALGNIGEAVLDLVISSLNEPHLREGALLTLQRLPAHKRKRQIGVFARNQVNKATHYLHLRQQCQGALQNYETPANQGNLVNIDAIELLADSLHQKSVAHGFNALKAMGSLRNGAAVSLAIENLERQNSSQQANAMETLDSVGDASIVRPLLPIWEEIAASQSPPDNWLRSILTDDDPWLRVCGALVAADLGDAETKSLIAGLPASDRDLLKSKRIDQTATGGNEMDTIPMLSTMERALFLRKVPIFADLAPSDILQIATISEERHFADGTLIAEQGKKGDVMYIIVEGDVVVKIKGQNGELSELGRRHPGDYVGEMAILSDEVRMASMYASGAVRTLSVAQGDFAEMLRQRPGISLALMRELIKRLRESGG